MGYADTVYSYCTIFAVVVKRFSNRLARPVLQLLPVLCFPALKARIHFRAGRLALRGFRCDIFAACHIFWNKQSLEGELCR